MGGNREAPQDQWEPPRWTVTPEHWVLAKRKVELERLWLLGSCDLGWRFFESWAPSAPMRAELPCLP